MRAKLKHLRYLGIALCAAAIGALYTLRLSFPPEPYYDEVYYVQFLHNLMYGHTIDYVSSHPPLWSLLAWPCVALWGDRSAIWRMVSLLAGLLLLPAVYALTKKITRDSLVAACAVFFLALDCISFTQARIAMFNSLSLLFMVLSLWMFLPSPAQPTRPRSRAMLGAGVFLGLALGAKLSSSSMFLIIYFLLMLEIMKNPAKRKALCCQGLLFLLILPLAIYVAVHAFIPLLPGYSWKSVWEIQKFNLAYHLKEAATQTHLYASPWWGWPLMMRPIWYYFASKDGVVNGILCIGNPAIFWMLPAMAAYLLWDWLRHKSKESGLILLGFFGQWLFYALGARLKFFHYIYFAMPFAAIGLAWLCVRAWTQGKTGKLVVCAYVALVVGMFLYWFPLLSGMPIPEKYYQQHMWFPAWI